MAEACAKPVQTVTFTVLAKETIPKVKGKSIYRQICAVVVIWEAAPQAGPAEHPREH